MLAYIFIGCILFALFVGCRIRVYEENRVYDFHANPCSGCAGIEYKAGVGHVWELVKHNSITIDTIGFYTDEELSDLYTGVSIKRTKDYAWCPKCRDEIKNGNALAHALAKKHAAS